MKKKINWGIIGPGKIAHSFAADLSLSKEGQLYGVASRDPEKAKRFAQVYQAENYYNSYEDLVRDPAIDIVYIATPHAFHFEHTMLCLKHGKAVLVEKPMGLNSEEVKAMIQEARSRKLFLMEAMWTRFIPATGKLIELLEENVIGDLIALHADFGFRRKPDPESRLFNKVLGGGALLDIGIYPVYLSLLTLGYPTDIKAMARMTKTGVDGYCAILFDYPTRAKAMLNASIEVDTPTEAVLYGTKGSLKLHQYFHNSEKISLHREGEEKEQFHLNYTGNGYVHEIDEVHQCLRNKLVESSGLPHQISLDLSTLMDRVKEQIGLNYKH